MKNGKRSGALFGALLFFITIAATVTLAVLAYVYADGKTDGDHGQVALVMLLVILFLSALCTLIDFGRRRFTVERPTEQILRATERIARGDFSARLLPRHVYGRYDEYDLIMENLNRMAEALSKSEVLKNDFLSNASHELKTPLTVIRNYAALLAREKDEERREEYAATLSRAAERLSNLVTNILKLSKLENERLLPEKTRFSLDGLLAETIVGYETRIEEKRIDLRCDLEEMSVESAAGYLEIVFSNLLSNAIKFTDEGGMVEVMLKKDGKNAVVRVRDTGCGISEETGARIFEKFYQDDTSHAQEGNGLGLALVKRVIDLLGGEISVVSELGKGSAFTVTLKNVVSE